MLSQARVHSLFASLFRIIQGKSVGDRMVDAHQPFFSFSASSYLQVDKVNWSLVERALFLHKMDVHAKPHESSSGVFYLPSLFGNLKRYIIACHRFYLIDH